MTEEDDKEAEHQVALVSALQLLLLDADQELKADLIHTAFPTLIVGADYQELRDRIWLVLDTVEQAMGIADGSSGLGALAAQNLNSQLKALRSRIESLGGFLNIDPKPKHQQKPRPRKNQQWIK